MKMKMKWCCCLMKICKKQNKINIILHIKFELMLVQPLQLKLYYFDRKLKINIKHKSIIWNENYEFIIIHVWVKYVTQLNKYEIFSLNYLLLLLILWWCYTQSYYFILQLGLEVFGIFTHLGIPLHGKIPSIIKILTLSLWQ